MKPNPHALLAASSGMGTGACVFVGDSISDLSAARSVEMPFIGLAQHTRKAALFSEQGCDAIVSLMTDLGCA